MFTRLAVAELGAIWVLSIRVISATLLLFIVSRFIRDALKTRERWRHYLFLGLFNTALPFLAFAWGATLLPASMLAILNSTAPLWGLLVGFIWRGKAITPRAVLGLLFGCAGVAALVGLSDTAVEQEQLLAVFACLGAAICYAIASSYAEFAERVPAIANAHGSLWAATLVILPLSAVEAPPTDVSTLALASALTLGILCSGIAYLMYFRLIAQVGAPSTLTVGYLIPLWGVFWGWLFLNEAVGWHTALGTILVLTGTALVTGLTFRRTKIAE